MEDKGENVCNFEANLVKAGFRMGWELRGQEITARPIM